MPRQPIPPLLSDDELATLSTISAAEREDAAAMWKADAPPDGRALLEAPEYEGEDEG